MLRKWLAFFVAASFFVASVFLYRSTSFAQMQPDRLADPIRKGGPPIKLETLATGLTAPNWGTSAPGDDERLFVTDQNGILWAIDLDTGAKSVFLDVSDRLVALGVGGPGTFDERGLLGVAFHPDYVTNGLLYTYTSEPVNGEADFSTIPPGMMANHQSVILEWGVPNPTDPDSVVDPTSARELLRIDEPQFNHDGGALNFGPDGMLHISLGDGGGRDDEGVGHVEGGNAQDPSNILGSIVRIDPAGSNSANGKYGIPDDNPFVGQPGFVEEIFAFGFRNPFRFSFDMAKGDLYVGDVGQDDIEEVDVVVTGGNYGWNFKEGSFCFDPNGSGPGFAFDADPCPKAPPDLIDPIAEYNTADDLTNNDEGRAVIGGFVYRGTSIKALVGRYVFGDYTRFTETGISNDGRLFFLNKKNVVRKNKIKQSKILEFRLVGQDKLGKAVLGFGQDANGELYVLANDTGIPFGAGDDFEIPTGVVLRIARDTVGRAPEFEADLDGAQEVPPVVTDTTGEIEVRFNNALTRAKFELEIHNGVAVTQAHFHCAPAGENGPVVVFLFGFVPGGVDVDGELARDTLTNDDLVGADCVPTIGMAINNMADLAQAMKDGNIYANVHTVANPPGEVRGQLEDDD